MDRGTVRWVLVAMMLAGCARVEAPDERAPVRAPIESRVYPASLVLDHQEAIGLSDAQRAAIRAALQDAQRELVDAELELRARRESLDRALSSPRVDEEAVMEAAALVADSERAIKLVHLRLLVRIKNELTAAQQQELDRLRGPATNDG